MRAPKTSLFLAYFADFVVLTWLGYMAWVLSVAAKPATGAWKQADASGIAYWLAVLSAVPMLQAVATAAIAHHLGRSVPNGAPWLRTISICMLLGTVPVVAACLVWQKLR